MTRKFWFFVFIFIIVIVALLFFFLGKKNETYKNVVSVKNTNWKLDKTGLKYPILGFVNNVLTPKECNEIIELGKQVVEPSIVGFDMQTDNSVRNSSHGWLESEKHPALLRVSLMLEHLTGFPRINQEPFQIVKYGPGQYYKYHLDSCNPEADDYEHCIENAKESGFRKYTFIIYLNDDYEGGTTHFSEINKHIKGKKGQAVYFKNIKDNNIDSEPISLHAGTEVRKGYKWIINCWIRTKAYVV